jgi:co-chaperonin GroES (HSP10)
MGGEELYLDTTYRPDHHKVITGEVVSIPGKLSKDHFSIGVIEPTVRVGDLVYFHYGVLSYDNSVELDGQVYYRLDYDAIFCYLRLGKLEMVGSWVFAKPIYGDDVELIDLGSGSTQMVQMSTSGFVVSTSPSPIENRAIIKHIGSSNTGELDLGVGINQEVWISSYCNFENEIQGEVYWTFRQRDILAK